MKKLSGKKMCETAGFEIGKQIFLYVEFFSSHKSPLTGVTWFLRSLSKVQYTCKHRSFMEISGTLDQGGRLELRSTYWEQMSLLASFPFMFFHCFEGKDVLLLPKLKKGRKLELCTVNSWEDDSSHHM